jgi:predicted DNA-binding transcriptional regulator AlpA
MHMNQTERVYVRAAYLLARLDISRTKLWRDVKSGRLPAPCYLPGGQRRWLLADLERWEAEHLRGEVKP